MNILNIYLDVDKLKSHTRDIYMFIYHSIFFHLYAKI